jgi:hypothetical protein
MPARPVAAGGVDIAVGRPVTRPPPHRSRRAELPHRAPQSYSHRIGGSSSPPRPSLWLALRLASWTGLAYPGEVSFTSYVALPTPSPCTRLSRAQSTMSRSDSSPAVRLPPFSVVSLTCRARRRWRPSSVSGFPLACLNIRIPYRHSQEPMGPPKFLTLLFQHARRSNPDRSSGISPCRSLSPLPPKSSTNR